MEFKRTVNTAGKIKSCMVTGDKQFVYSETGEIFDLAGILHEIYGDEPFDISTTQKSDDEITPNVEG